MTLTRDARSSIAAAAAVLILLTSLFLGNQRHAQAALGSDIVCFVFDQLNHVGTPLPVLDAHNCVNPPGAPAQCADGIDNDGDGKVDMQDPGCTDPADNSEFNAPVPLPQCADGIDNDGDGKIDFVPVVGDPGCDSLLDNDETNAPPPPPLAQCADGIDNDGDGKVDMQDPGCSSPTDTDETDPTGGGGTPAQCADGIDNDGDGKIDLADPGCANASDTDETDPAPGGGGSSPHCADGIDNDGDGKVDMDDPGCSSLTDTDETDPTTGGGGTSTPPPSSGGGGGGGGGGGNGAPIQLSFGGGEVLGAEDCNEYLTAHIKYGQANDTAQVLRLQTFLVEFEGAQIATTGVYDAPTHAAVHAFQAKYAADILAPWKITTSTGYVYLTTKKKINEIYCKGEKLFPLTQSELSVIQRVIAAAGSAPVLRLNQAPAAQSKAPAAPAKVNVTEQAAAAIIAGSAGTGVGTTTPAAGRSWWQRVLDFLTPPYGK